MQTMTRVLLPQVMLVLACCAGNVYAAESRTPNPEEFREQIRQFNESGKFPGRGPGRPGKRVSKAVEQYERAVYLHSKKDASASDLKEAASLYQSASDAGLPQASVNLALLCLGGKGAKKDVKKAVTLLNIGSKSNLPQADMALANLYLTGKEVKKNDKKGEWHLNRAAKTGNPNAVKMLADYREWKKKNDLAMKQYQEILNKSQSAQVKPQLSPVSTLPTEFFGQAKMDYPLIPSKPALSLPVIPGYPFLGTSQHILPIVASSPPAAPLTTVAPTAPMSDTVSKPLVPSMEFPATPGIAKQ